MAALHLGIAGAGLLGRLLAWTLAREGHRVEVFDPAEGPEPRFDGQGAAGFTAAGLLSPLAERDVASERIAALGWRSRERVRARSHRAGECISWAYRGSAPRRRCARNSRPRA